MWRLKRWWYLSKLDYYHLGLALGMALKSHTSVSKEFKLKARKFWGANSYVCRSCMGKTGRGFPPILNMVKVKRAQEARVNQFLFQNVQNNEIFEIFKMFENNSWINVYCTKANACGPWTDCCVFVWDYLFWVNLVQKLKIVSLRRLNFVIKLILICRIPLLCSYFLFSTGSFFLSKFGPLNQNCQFELKFGIKLIWICRIQWWCSIFLFKTRKILFG